MEDKEFNEIMNVQKLYDLGVLDYVNDVEFIKFFT